MIGWYSGGGVLPSNHFVPKNNPGLGTQMGGRLLPRFVVSGGWEVTLGPSDEAIKWPLFDCRNAGLISD